MTLYRSSDICCKTRQVVHISSKQLQEQEVDLKVKDKVKFIYKNSLQNYWADSVSSNLNQWFQRKLLKQFNRWTLKNRMHLIAKSSLWALKCSDELKHLFKITFSLNCKKKLHHTYAMNSNPKLFNKIQTTSTFYSTYIIFGKVTKSPILQLPTD